MPECGTRPAYRRHLRLGEPVDEPCRIANAKADRRLRETGTTKEKPTEPVKRPRAVEAPAASLRADAWREFAACREVDPELFFPEAGQSPAAARLVCSGCPVLEECAVHALGEGSGTPEPLGVWGGMTAQERLRILQARRKAAA